ncbi:putative siderophore iron transporter [Phaeomoniella chlamydospora]|uniref:Putative siderophore iron transporter n=1 Tax=Phaeomoniella chlamydospora TaxID=158046 RepID=A0A0G2EKC9_PHACM|nr:putative siderophore iron transporter [Phaeomoniella chlamydospora]
MPLWNLKTKSDGGPVTVEQAASTHVDVEAEKTPDDTRSTVDEFPDKNAQHGIQQIEAVTVVWSKSHLYLAYLLILLIYFVDSLQQQTTNQLTPYVYSDFQLHSLIPVTGILSSIIGALVKLPLAKILDVWGRPLGFTLMVACCTLGLIMMAACKNVETYCAAQVFYWVGYNGMTYVLGVFIADTSKLENRGLMFAYANSPYIATTWAGGPAATSFLKNSGWPWGFGTFAIVTPVVSSPLIFLFLYNYRKAARMNLMPPPSERTWLQSCKYYAIEFDRESLGKSKLSWADFKTVFGIILLASGLALFLLPFSLYSYQGDGWRSSMIICMIIFGGLLIIAFVFYEKYWAPKTFIPFSLLVDRTVLGACILAGTLFVSYYCWDGYFSSFLQVVQNQSITHTTYISNIYTIGSCFWAIVVGILIKWSGTFRWLALYMGLPLQILGIGLMIHFRQPDTNIGYVVMCQIFIAFGGGTLVICEQIAAMAAAKHENIATVLAIESMFSSIGGAIGSTVSAAIWTGTFPKALEEYLPENAQADLYTIYGSLVQQLSYPVGSETRDAINKAYGVSQRYMCIAGTSILVIGVAATAVWRDIKVKDFKQVKGTVI